MPHAGLRAAGRFAAARVAGEGDVTAPRPITEAQFMRQVLDLARILGWPERYTVSDAIRRPGCQTHLSPRVQAGQSLALSQALQGLRRSHTCEPASGETWHSRGDNTRRSRGDPGSGPVSLLRVYHRLANTGSRYSPMQWRCERVRQYRRCLSTLQHLEIPRRLARPMGSRL